MGSSPRATRGLRRLSCEALPPILAAMPGLGKPLGVSANDGDGVSELYRSDDRSRRIADLNAMAQIEMTFTDRFRRHGSSVPRGGGNRCGEIGEVLPFIVG
jgi:hypothetical protein